MQVWYDNCWKIGFQINQPSRCAHCASGATSGSQSRATEGPVPLDSREEARAAQAALRRERGVKQIDVSDIERLGEVVAGRLQALTESWLRNLRSKLQAAGVTVSTDDAVAYLDATQRLRNEVLAFQLFTYSDFVGRFGYCGDDETETELLRAIADNAVRAAEHYSTAFQRFEELGQLALEQLVPVVQTVALAQMLLYATDADVDEVNSVITELSLTRDLWQLLAATNEIMADTLGDEKMAHFWRDRAGGLVSPPEPLP